MIIAKNERGLKDQIRLTLDKWSDFSEEDNIQRFNEYLGLRLRLRRISLNLTQTKVAKMLNITFQQVQKYEKGVNRVPIDKLLAIGIKTKKEDINYFLPNDISGETLVSVEEIPINTRNLKIP